MRDKLLRMLGIGMFTLLLPVLATGCNTIEGIGKDTQSAGEAIEEEAEEEKDDY